MHVVHYQTSWMLQTERIGNTPSMGMPATFTNWTSLQGAVRRGLAQVHPHAAQSG